MSCVYLRVYVCRSTVYSYANDYCIHYIIIYRRIIISYKISIFIFFLQICSHYCCIVRVKCYIPLWPSGFYICFHGLHESHANTFISSSSSSSSSYEYQIAVNDA